MGSRKLCIIVPTHWSVRIGGSQYQAQRLLETLIAKTGFELFFLSRLTAPDYKTTGYQLFNVSANSGFKHGRFLTDIPKLYRTLKSITPDVIYQRVGCTFTGVAAYYGKHHDCNTVWHVASDSDLQRSERPNGFIKKVEKNILEYGVRNANHIVTQTLRQSDLLKNNYGRAATATIPNFHPLPEEIIDKSGPVNVVWIGNFKEVKQPELFIKLASELQHIPDVKFTMIGDKARNPAWQDILRTSIEKLKNLDYVGEKKQDEVNEILAKAHILVNTSQWEGFSNTFVQAWMREVPVVSLNVNPDGLLDGDRIGRMSGDFSRLVTDVADMATNMQLRRSMGARARDYAFKTHSEKNVDQLIELFDQ